jgi:tyrosine-protein kinase Etk/Wzc
MNFDGNTNGLTDHEDTEINLREVLFKYLHHWKWLVLSVLFFLALAFVYIKITTPLYLIETDLLIKQDKSNAGGGGGEDILKSLNLFSSDKIIDNEVQILKSYTLFGKMVKALGLQAFYYEDGGIRKIPIYKNLPFHAELLKSTPDSYKDYLNVKLLNDREAEVDGIKRPLNHPFTSNRGTILITTNHIDPAYLNTGMYVRFNNLDDFFQGYVKNLDIEPISKEGTVLIITYSDAIPERGEDILNRLVYEYNNAAVEDKNKVTASTLSFIDERLKSLAGELGIAETQVENYKSANKITDIGQQSQVFMQGIEQNDADLGKVNIQLSVLNNLAAYVNNQHNTEQLPSMLSITEPTLLGLVNELAQTQLKKESLLQTIPETNPIVHSINDQLNSLRTAINQSVRDLESGLNITKQQLENKNKSFESIIKKVPSQEHGLLDVTRQQSIKDTLFNFLLQKREEQEMSLASNLPDSRTVDVARSTPKPVKPVKFLVILIFFILGILFPAGIIYFQDILNNKIKKRTDIDKITNTPILGEIAHSDESSSLLVVAKPRSMVAEQIRALRTNLQFISPGPDHKVLLFTSGISGEGKSFVSLNLGASLAMSGKKIVILELDLRRPKLHIALGIDNDQGLSNYLISNISYKNIIKEVPQLPGYYIITCGPIPPNPAELLMNGRVETLINELKLDFDFVFVDAPPVGLVTDAQILGKFADATIFIVRHNYTLKSQVHLIDDLYRNNKFSNLNIVFNSIDYSSSYGYSYGYGYGYGNYYHEDKPKKLSWLTKPFKTIRKKQK